MVKLTKNELRDQQKLLSQLQKYLPTLQLKKAMLQSEVSEARLEIIELEKSYEIQYASVEQFSSLLSEQTSINPKDLAKVSSVRKRYENIAGVEVPYFEEALFEDVLYSLFDTPPWIDAAMMELRSLRVALEKINVVQEKKRALEKELREVSIRVNLFEKILIPRALRNIKKIRVFLGDLQLAAVSQAKVAKRKIEAHKLSDQMREEANAR